MASIYGRTGRATSVAERHRQTQSVINYELAKIQGNKKITNYNYFKNTPEMNILENLVEMGNSTNNQNIVNVLNNLIENPETIHEILALARAVLDNTIQIEELYGSVSVLDVSNLRLIIFYNPLQKENSQLLEIERQVIEFEPEAIEDVSNPCRKCHGIKSFKQIVQMRRGDEGADYFVKCAKCKYVWRIHT